MPVDRGRTRLRLHNEGGRTPGHRTVRVREALDRLLEVISPRVREGEDLVFSGPSSGRQAVALTFDDGPSPSNTPRLLDILAETRARATFFVVGARIAGHEEILRRTVAEGHEIGNHTYSHQHTIALTRAELRRDLERANEVIAVATHDVRLSRPPFGKDRRRVAAASRELGMRTVLWSIDSGDTSGHSRTRITATVAGAVSTGSIVLMHDGHGLRPETLQATAAIIPELQKRGFELVTVSELLDSRRESAASQASARAGRPLP